jgi:hypothetical protein
MGRNLTSDDLAYRPTVEVEPVFLITCDGGCGWSQSMRDEHKARVVAAAHRLWHQNILDAYESDMGPCSSCGAIGEGFKLAEGRNGCLPFLYCIRCGADR